MRSLLGGKQIWSLPSLAHIALNASVKVKPPLTWAWPLVDKARERESVSFCSTREREREREREFDGAPH